MLTETIGRNILGRSRINSLEQRDNREDNRRRSECVRILHSCHGGPAKAAVASSPYANHGARRGLALFWHPVIAANDNT